MQCLSNSHYIIKFVFEQIKILVSSFLEIMAKYCTTRQMIQLKIMTNYLDIYRKFGVGKSAVFLSINRALTWRFGLGFATPFYLDSLLFGNTSRSPGFSSNLRQLIYTTCLNCTRYFKRKSLGVRQGGEFWELRKVKH